MKSMKHFLFASLALVLLLSCVGVGPANAQGLAGKFTLPFVAHWGGATLPPGEYHFTISRPNGILYVATGRMNVGMVLPESFNSQYAAASSLLVTQTAGVKSIRELRLASTGVVLYFPPAKATGRMDERELTVIPVCAPGE
jgi:hypothetical protein